MISLAWCRPPRIACGQSACPMTGAECLSNIRYTWPPLSRTFELVPDQKRTRVGKAIVCWVCQNSHIQKSALDTYLSVRKKLGKKTHLEPSDGAIDRVYCAKHNLGIQMLNKPLVQPTIKHSSVQSKDKKYIVRALDGSLALKQVFIPLHCGLLRKNDCNANRVKLGPTCATDHLKHVKLTVLYIAARVGSVHTASAVLHGALDDDEVSWKIDADGERRCCAQQR